MDHWTLGAQLTTYLHYEATSSRPDPAPHAFGMRRRGADSETQTHGATPDETATPDRRPKPSTADWRREAGSSAGTPQQLPTCIGAPKTMETNTGHSGMESGGTTHERTTRNIEEDPPTLTHRSREPPTAHRSPIFVALCALSAALAARTLPGMGRANATASGGITRERTTRHTAKDPLTPAHHSREPPIAKKPLIKKPVWAFR